MNVTPAERRGSQAKTTSRTPLAWLLFLFALSSLLPYIHLPLSLLSSAPASQPWYTWRTTVPYVALQDAFSRSSSPYPFSINARRRRLSTTSRGTSLETRVCSCWKEEKVRLDRRDSLRAISYAGIVPTTGRPALFRLCQVTCLRVRSFTRRSQPIAAIVTDLLLLRE